MSNKIQNQLVQRIAVVSAMLFAFFSLPAQEVFTEYIQKQGESGGSIIVVQDSLIEALVNGRITQAEIAEVERELTASDSMAQGLPKHNPEKFAKKNIGYRIQIYSGGNSRSDKMAAERAQAKCRQLFPQLSTYVSFISPRWTCRVGNFSTAAAAEKYLVSLRQSGTFKGVTLVKCKIVSRD